MIKKSAYRHQPSQEWQTQYIERHYPPETEGVVSAEKPKSISKETDPWIDQMDDLH